MDAVRKQIEQEQSTTPEYGRLWQKLGWLGVTIPEQYGGLGMTLADAVPIVESRGRYLMGSPFVATTLAAQALITSGNEAQKNQWLSEIASGAAASVGLTEEDGNWRLQEIAATAKSKRRNPVAGRHQVFRFRCQASPGYCCFGYVRGRCPVGIDTGGPKVPSGALCARWS
ncbi:MAG: hypothetical protein CM15mP120_24220 [Pseudomonadota bacterium]|nr:MAG: hypothetical protein CM15mP120_24220 [Pseudomonadota bacterium]